MPAFRNVCASLAAIAVAVLCSLGCLLVQDARRAVADTAAQLAETQRTALAIATTTAWMADQRTGEALAEVRALRRVGDIRLQEIQSDARIQISHVVTMADRRSGEAIAEVTQARRELAVLRTDLSAVLGQTRALAVSSTRAVDLLAPQALGLVAAAKVTMGETAQAARRIDAALPAALVTWDQLGVQTAGVATDVHAFTSKWIAPRPLKAKIWDGVKTTVWGVSRFR